MKQTRSQEIFQQAQTLMPGGVNSPARAFGAVGGDPVVIDRADGAYLFDVDGNRYIDYVGSWGPMILGHRHPAVLAALEEALAKGTSFGTPTVAENRLAEMVVEAVPSIEKVRLVNSGTEATMSAVRLARGYSGRDKIVKFSGNYHGHSDSMLVAAGSAGATLGVPNSPGVTAATAADTITLPYNDETALVGAFQEHGDAIACVIVEPVAGNMGCIVASGGFRTTLREMTRKHGALLIFDEVMSGFRVAYGGAQALFGIEPDLTTLGKVIGGGLPVGAYGGKAEIMDRIMPAGPISQAGTLSGNPLATAAGIATLTVLRDENPYEALEQKSTRLAVGLEEAAKARGIPCSIGWCGAMLTLFFNEQKVVDWETASQCDTDRFARYFHAMLERGVYLPCSQYEALFLSTAHSDEDLQATLDAAAEVFDAIASA